MCVCTERSTARDILRYSSWYHHKGLACLRQSYSQFRIESQTRNQFLHDDRSERVPEQLTQLLVLFIRILFVSGSGQLEWPLLFES
jgi:hypothetical protein